MYKFLLPGFGCISFLCSKNRSYCECYQSVKKTRDVGNVSERINIHLEGCREEVYLRVLPSCSTQLIMTKCIIAIQPQRFHNLSRNKIEMSTYCWVAVGSPPETVISLLPYSLTHPLILSHRTTSNRKELYHSKIVICRSHPLRFGTKNV